MERCCFPSFDFWLALLLPFLLGVAFLFLLLLGADAALGPRRLIYRFVSFVFQFYFHVCGLLRVIFLLLFPVLFCASFSALFPIYFHFSFPFSFHIVTIIDMFKFLPIFLCIFWKKRRGEEGGGGSTRDAFTPRSQNKARKWRR